jgi:hypothetical protein
MKRSELRQIIKEEITKVLNESSPSSILLDVELDNDTINDWESDPQIKKFEEEGRVGIQMLDPLGSRAGSPYDSWSVWGVEGDDEVEKYVVDNYGE